MSAPKPPRNPLAKQPATKPQQKHQPPQPPQPRFNARNFSLGGRRFNGQATRRGTRH